MNKQKKVFGGFRINANTFMWTHEIGELDVNDVINSIKDTLDGRPLSVVLNKIGKKKYFYKVTFPQEVVHKADCKLRKDITVYYRSESETAHLDIDLDSFTTRMAREKTSDTVYNITIRIQRAYGEKAYFTIGSYDNESDARAHQVACQQSDQPVCTIKMGKWFSPNSCEVLNFPNEHYYNMNGDLPSIDWNGIDVKSGDEFKIDLRDAQFNSFRSVGHFASH